MNRNLVVGGVLFGLLLAALSVGISTFISAQDSQAINAQIEKVSIQANKVPVAAKADNPVAGTAPSSGEASAVVAYLPVDGAVASDLSSTGYLWSQGALLVTDPYVTSKYMFSVDTTDGVRVYKDVAVTIEDQLTVTKQSLLSDVDASGKVTVAGLVQGGSFSNAGGSFVVDSAGAVGAASLVAGSGTFSNGLAVTGGQFRAGDPTNVGVGGILWDPALRKFIVNGKVEATEIEGKDGTLKLAGNVQADSFALTSGNGQWSSEGTMTTKSVVVTSDSLKVGTDRLVVGSTGAVLKGDLTVTNAVVADSASIGSTLTVAGGKFVVDATRAELTGNLNIVGDAYARNFFADNLLSGDALDVGSFSVFGSALNATGTLTVDGDIDGNFIGTIDSDVDASSKNVTAKQNLRVGTSPSYVFTVDSSGNVDADGNITGEDVRARNNLTVDNDGTVGGDLVVTGDVTAANIPHMQSGVAVVSGGGPENVPVSGMPSGASVVVTPRFSTSNPVWVTVNSDDFDLNGDDGSYSWIATW